MRLVLKFVFTIFVAGSTAEAQIAATQPAVAVSGAAALSPAASTQPSTTSPKM